MAPAAFNTTEDSAHEAKHCIDKQRDDKSTALDGLFEGLQRSPKTVPCSYLYDAAGSELYNMITQLEEYYPFAAETALLQAHAVDIVSQIPRGAVLVELGCGSAEKSGILLQALLDRDGPGSTKYVGIDVSADFLEQARTNLLAACPALKAENMDMVEETYMEGVRKARLRHQKEVLVICWLGSSIGNLSPAESLAFFQDLMRVSGPNMEVFLCTDLWKDAAVLKNAYNDPSGVTAAFITNGMRHVQRVLAKVDDSSSSNKQAGLWAYDCLVNSDAKQVEMYVVAQEDVDLGRGIKVARGERVLMEVSRKFTLAGVDELAYRSGLFLQARWADGLYGVQLLATGSLALRMAWRDTDALFAAVPDWSVAPISIRHPFCFYYGHLPSFARLKLLPQEEASEWDVMFSRGIDPDVADPSCCHSHPDAPATWPPRSEIVAYAHQARAAVLAAVEGGRCSAYATQLALEHELLHQETLAYMLAQLRKQEFEAGGTNGHIAEKNDHNSKLAAQNGSAHNGSLQNGKANAHIHRVHFVAIPAGDVTLGCDMDPEKGFRWDNEGPLQPPQHVRGFSVASRPVTVAEFRDFVVRRRGYDRAQFWDAADFELLRAAKQTCPATWTLTEGGEVTVHSPMGSRGWLEVADTPVLVSLAEARAFLAARGDGSRVMTEPEYQRIIDYDPMGVEVAQMKSDSWEWTSSAFAPLPGFHPMPDYPEYSADFFDGKHFTLRGASASTPRSVVRDSFRNFYQGNYPYMFAKFRVCCD